MTTFLDASHHQTLDQAVYWAAHDRLALKVSEGIGFRDPAFPDRYRYAVARHKPLDLYHFDRARFDGAEQFDYYLDAIRDAGGPRPFPLDLLCLDSEDTNNPADADTSATRFTYRGGGLGYPGSLYTGVWYANPYKITANILHPGWRRLWLSDYNPAHLDATMRLPNGWDRRQVAARQFTSTARVPGVPRPADYSRVLLDWLATAPPVAPPPPPREDTDMIIMRRDDDGTAWLLREHGISGVSSAALTGFAKAGLPSVAGFSDAQLSAMRATLGDDPAAGLGDAVKTLAEQVTTLATGQQVLAAKFAALASVLQHPGGVDAAQLHQIAVDAAREAVDGLTVTVHEGPVT